MQKRTTLLLSLILCLLLISLTACGGDDEAEAESAPAATAQTEPDLPVGDAKAGQQTFAQTCAACHGPEGKGVPNLGKDMTSSEFIGSKTDKELLDFIKVGRDPSDPLNTTGVAMPPKGGNPALSDDDLINIIAFIRSIQK